MKTWLCTLGMLGALGCNNELQEDTGPESACPEVSDLGATAVFGRLYVDSDGADQSRHASSFDTADSPVVGQTVRLHGLDGPTETSSCENGTFAFDALESGPYVLGTDHPDAECMQRNCTRRFPAAIEEGQVTVVTVGDSIPVIGDAPMFPDRLESLIGGLAEVDNRNVAVAGSLSTQWVPGTNHFESRLRPHIADADVIIISVGGNDITNGLNASALQDIDKAIADTFDLVTDIVDNIRDMATEIRSINPDVDIVYCLYVNYGDATIYPWGLAANFLPEGTIHDILISAREQVPSDENILLADLFGASLKLEAPLDDYLYDSLHFNDKGQTMYAQEVFQSLGGVLIGDSPLGGDPTSPLNLRPNYSYGPAL